MIYDSIIIGKGLIGSAAAKYLSQSQKNVALIGPDETMAINEGIVFSSHYDQARIQRIIGKDAAWTLLNKQSLAQYAALENETNIHFHSGVGCLYVNPYGNDDYLDTAPEQAKKFKQKYQAFENGELIHSSFPDFNFPTTAKGIFESSPAGYINPRLLVKAQLISFKKKGGEIFNDTVNDIISKNGIKKITTLSGKIYHSKKVLLAPGAFVNFFNLLKRKLVLHLKSETTVWAKVNNDEALRLRKLPSLLYEIAEPEIQNIYLAQPVQYPDGKNYLKMGANLQADIIFNNLKGIQDWFKTGNSDRNLKILQNALMKIMPTLSVKGYTTSRCIVVFTKHGKPYIGTIDNDLFVAAGGNGYSAMCSDALGKIASTLLLETKFPKEFSSADFQPIFTEPQTCY